MLGASLVMAYLLTACAWFYGPVLLDSPGGLCLRPCTTRVYANGTRVPLASSSSDESGDGANGIPLTRRPQAEELVSAPNASHLRRSAWLGQLRRDGGGGGDGVQQQHALLPSVRM